MRHLISVTNHYQNRINCAPVHHMRAGLHEQIKQQQKKKLYPSSVQDVTSYFKR